jgi:hypothetical protein
LGVLSRAAPSPKSSETRPALKPLTNPGATFFLAAVTNPATWCDLVDGDDGVLRPEGESYAPGPGLSAPGLGVRELRFSPLSDRPKVPLRLDGDGEFIPGTMAS